MSQIEGKWKGAGGGIQLFMLIVFWNFGSILAALLAHVILGEGAAQTPQQFRLFNGIGTVLLFLMPFIAYSYLFADLRGTFVTHKKINWLVMLLGAIAMLCIQPLVELVNSYNELIKLPESMAAIQEALEQGEEASKKALMLLFEDKSVSMFLLNILAFAVLPGILEEFFFRGCMQRSILLASKNIHVAIWITAILFSLFHFQISGFFPRILLGALLGYLYAWSGNIWIPAIAHMVNNAGVVFMEQFMKDTSFYKTLNASSESVIPAVISLILVVGILFLVYKLNKRTSESPSY